MTFRCVRTVPDCAIDSRDMKIAIWLETFVISQTCTCREALLGHDIENRVLLVSTSLRAHYTTETCNSCLLSSWSQFISENHASQKTKCKTITQARAAGVYGRKATRYCQNAHDENGAY